MEFDAIVLSIRIGLIATVVNLPLAVLVAGVLTRGKFKGKSLLNGVINLPLVMPPVTTGYLLLMVLGRKGFIGSFLYSTFNINIAFTQIAAVLASMIVSFPLIVRSISVSMEMVDRDLEKAASTLGAGRLEVFKRVTFPLILPGVFSGAVLGFARCLGEFGATITFAGNILGETRTIPLSVYSLLQVPGKEDEAALLVAVSIFISFGAMVLSGKVNNQLKRKKGKVNGN